MIVIILALLILVGMPISIYLHLDKQPSWHNFKLFLKWLIHK